MPLELIDGSGKFRRFRLELQEGNEKITGCGGCAFSSELDSISCELKFPRRTVASEVADQCVDHPNMVWKEVK